MDRAGLIGAADPEISLIGGSPGADSSPVSHVRSASAGDQARHEGNQSESVGREDSEGGSELSLFEIDWLDVEVAKAISVYSSSSSIQSFIDSVDILDDSLLDHAFSARRCLPSDRVFHGQGSSDFDFLFLYSKLVKDSRLRLPLDEFSIRVLRALNVALTQLHPNSWAYLRGFQMLCLGLGLTATPVIFLHHYCTRPGKKVGWLSLVSQNKNRLLGPYSSSYKCFKDTYFKVVINPESRQFVFDGAVSKFPLYWTRKPTKFTLWPRFDLLADDFIFIGKLDQLPCQIPTRRLIECLTAIDPAGVAVGKRLFCILNFHSSASNLYFVFCRHYPVNGSVWW